MEKSYTAEQVADMIMNDDSHCIKSVCIRSYSGLYFRAFGLNRERYHRVSLRIHSKGGKMQTRITPNMDTFYAVIGEVESADSLDEKSSSCSSDDDPSSQSQASSSNDKPSSQSEVDSSNNSDSEFHGRWILIWKCSVRNCPLKCAKTKREISNHGRTIRTRWGISNYMKTIRTREGISNHGKNRRRTVKTRGGVQNYRRRDTAHTSHSKLNETMDNNGGSNEQQNDIMDEFADSNEQQCTIMDNGNAEKSNVDINISETTAVDKEIGSNNKGYDKTDNDT